MKDEETVSIQVPALDLREVAPHLADDDSTGLIALFRQGDIYMTMFIAHHMLGPEGEYVPPEDASVVERINGYGWQAAYNDTHRHLRQMAEEGVVLAYGGRAALDAVGKMARRLNSGEADKDRIILECLGIPGPEEPEI